MLILGLAWVYLLATSLQNAFTDVVAVAGVLFAVFYVLTALATIVYYRRRILAGLWDGLVLGVLPLAAAAFLVWVIAKSLQAAPAGQLWSLAAILLTGWRRCRRPGSGCGRRFRPAPGGW